MKKRDILKLAIFILAAACIPLLMFLLVLAPTVDWLGIILPTLSAFAYAASCLVILIWGSIQVIWQLPLKKPLRAIVFLSWAILYPILCVYWFAGCFFYLLTVLDVHC